MQFFASVRVESEYRVLRVEHIGKNGELPVLLNFLYYLDDQQI